MKLCYSFMPTKVAIINGGYRDSSNNLNCANDAEIYDDATKTTTATGWNLPGRYKGCSFYALGKIYMLGGIKCSTGEILNTVDILDPLTGFVTSERPMTYPRHSFACTSFFKDGEFYAFATGGVTNLATEEIAPPEILSLLNNPSIF